MMLSIAVPTIGRSPYFSETLISIQRGAPEQCEILVFFNGCNVYGVPASVRQDRRFRFESSDKLLPPHASWDHAVRLCTRPNVMFVGDDDVLLPTFNDWWSQRSPDEDFSITGFRLIDSEGKPLPYRPNSAGPIDKLSLGYDLVMGRVRAFLGGVVFSKSDYIACGGFVDLGMSNGWFIDTYLWGLLGARAKCPHSYSAPVWSYRINNHQMAFSTNVRKFSEELPAALSIYSSVLPVEYATSLAIIHDRLIFSRIMNNRVNSDNGGRMMATLKSLADAFPIIGMPGVVSVCLRFVVPMLFKRRPHLS